MLKKKKTWKFGLTILVYLGADKSGLCRDMLMVKVRILPEIGQKSEIPFSNKVFFFSRIVSVFLPGSQGGVKSLLKRNAIMSYLQRIRNKNN